MCVQSPPLSRHCRSGGGEIGSIMTDTVGSSLGSIITLTEGSVSIIMSAASSERVALEEVLVTFAAE